MKTLYKKDSKGKIRQWNVSIVQKEENGKWFLETSDGIHGGKIKDSTYKEAVPNNRFKTSFEKAEFMMQSAIDMKLRSNYFESIEDIKEEDVLFMPTGCPSGMIWEEWKNKDHVVYPALASGKLDGSKMYSTWREERVFLNTRSAKEHKNFRHIEKDLAEFYKYNKNIVLDGEAYNHDYKERFEELQSIFRKETPTEEQRQLSKEIARFYIYDVVDLDRPNLSALERQELLIDLIQFEFNKYDSLIGWPSSIVKSEKEYDMFHEQCMNAGFEGSVLKIASAPYVQRKNKMVMKRKPKFDCEFKIIDIVEGTGTHKGIAAGVTIDLQYVDGMNIGHRDQLAEDFQDAGFASGWNHNALKEILENKENYIGKMGTVEYGGLTAYGKLRFPKFKALRTD